jgi:hypothetical protein
LCALFPARIEQSRLPHTPWTRTTPTPPRPAERVLLQIIVAASSTAGGSGSASIDPFIFVDPQLSNAGDYAITVSDGVANIPPVPEPSAWMLSLASFGGLGVVRSRRTLGAEPSVCS